jgi:hypothetical protein
VREEPPDSRSPSRSGTTTKSTLCRCHPVSAPGANRHSVTRTCGPDARGRLAVRRAVSPAADSTGARIPSKQDQIKPNKNYALGPALMTLGVSPSVMAGLVPATHDLASHINSSRGSRQSGLAKDATASRRGRPFLAHQIPLALIRVDSERAFARLACDAHHCG